jgi:proteic killer suppression protein
MAKDDATPRRRRLRQICRNSLLHGIHVSGTLSAEVIQVIRSFGNKATAALYHGLAGAGVRGLPQDVLRIALHKLDVLDAATKLTDLRSPPGNRLEALKRDLAGYYGIRINDQWRILLRWEEPHALDVAIVDDH